MNNKAIKTALLYSIYQIIFWVIYMIMCKIINSETQKLFLPIFTTALFIALVCITKPIASSALCMVLTQFLLYLLIICHPNINGYIVTFRVSVGIGNVHNSKIYLDGLISVIFKLICESIVFGMCAIAFAVINRIKKGKNIKK